MKNKDNSEFYETLKSILWGAIVLALALYVMSLCACSLIDAPIPKDWKFTPNPIDTVQIDTIDPEPLEVDTCEELIEYTEPAFVTLYMKFDEPQDSVLWEGGGIQSYDLAEVVSHITSLSAKVDTSPIGASVILKGTNNSQQFHVKIFTRIDGAKWYMGCDPQVFIFPGMSASKYKENIAEFPSFKVWSFYGSDVSCDEAIAICREVLKDCHEGRDYADLFFSPCPIPQTIIDSLDLYGWDRIRQ